MSIDVTAEVQVRRDREAVAAYMSDPANDAEWIGGVREARLLGAPPLAVGSRVRRVARFLGRRVEYVTEVERLDRGRCVEMRSVVAPFPMRITYTFEDRDGSTLVSNRVRGGGLPLVAPLVRRSVQRDLERVRAVLERG
jgi:Polyketide cyclase / dehydrase and lipid transport